MSGNSIEQAIAQLAIQHGLIDPDAALSMIMKARFADGRPLLDMVKEVVAEADLLQAIATELGVSYVDLSASDHGLSIDDASFVGLEMGFLEGHVAIPMKNSLGQNVFLLSNTLDIDAVNYLRTRIGDGLVALASTAQIQSRLLAISSGLNINIAPGPNAVVEWVNALITYALAERASDIHFRYHGDGQLFTRIRVDGVLWRVPVPPAIVGREQEVVASVLARSSTIDSSNTREPQDGMFTFSAGGRNIDLRIGLIPQVTGANVTLRILDSAAISRRPEEMGLNPNHVAALRDELKSPQGCIMFVGPTGSGKTSSLYALLREVDAVQKNVVTVEDPVEYQIPYVGQTQVRLDLGERSVTWSRALRSILRNDPDIVLIGEIRDEDVARTAIEASVTGHLVLTTLHAQSAPGAFLRLSQMGVSPFMTAEAITAVVSQRLVRRVHECAIAEPPTADEVATLRRHGLDVPSKVMRAVGCSECSGSGFKGRLAVAELLLPDQAFRDLVSSGTATSGELRTAAKRCGWDTLAHDVYRVIDAGLTTVSELERVVGTTGDDTQPELSLPPVFGGNQ